MYVCMYVCVCVCMYVCMYACMYVCMYVHACIYVYVWVGVLNHSSKSKMKLFNVVFQLLHLIQLLQIPLGFCFTNVLK